MTGCHPFLGGEIQVNQTVAVRFEFVAETKTYERFFLFLFFNLIFFIFFCFFSGELKCAFSFPPHIYIHYWIAFAVILRKICNAACPSCGMVTEMENPVAPLTSHLSPPWSPLALKRSVFRSSQWPGESQTQIFKSQVSTLTKIIETPAARSESPPSCSSLGRDKPNQQPCILLHCSGCIKLASRVTAGQEAGNNADKVSFQRRDPLQAARQKTINNW